ncbi:hypothetical protein RUND412_002866 [Rhizina undulata]
MSNSQTFLDAAASIKNLKSKPKDEELLALYAPYKQATEGDAPEKNPKNPGVFDFAEKAKFAEWVKLRGTSKEAAEAIYIQKAEELKAKYGLA